MKQRGFSLIELMISALIGLVLLLGVINILSASRQVYRSNNGLAQIQESSRIAFELLARDVRQAQLIPCGDRGRVANVLNNASTTPLRQWLGFRGFAADTASIAGVPTGTAATNRVTGFGALLVQGTENMGYTLVGHDTSNAIMTIASNATNLATNDILMVCDITQASIFQATDVSVNGSGQTLVTHDNNFGTTGNCSRGLGVPISCGTVQGNTFSYNSNATVSRFYSSIWYLGNNGQQAEGGRSLYRARLEKNNIVYEEIVSGVSDLVLEYHTNASNQWQDASLISNWEKVDAVRITLAVQTTDTDLSTTTSGNGRLERRVSHIIALRNRTP